MKIVLRHKITGRYYNAPGQWVRRADNALVFDDMPSAHAFSRANRLDETQPVQRFAPYMMALLRKPPRSVWNLWNSGRMSQWYARHLERFTNN